MLNTVDETLSDDAEGEDNLSGATLLASNSDGKKNRDKSQQQSNTKNAKVGKKFSQNDDPYILLLMD